MGDCFALLGPPLFPWDLMAQNHIHNHGHCNSMTELAQSQKLLKKIKLPKQIEKSFFFIGLDVNLLHFAVQNFFFFSLKLVRDHADNTAFLSVACILA